MNFRQEIASKKILYALLAVAVALSVFSHSMVFREFVQPTYGNTLIHVASARHLVEHGFYPMQDYSYGGTVKNLYIPFYRFTVAEIVLLSGVDFYFAGRFLVMLFAVLLPLGFFLLGRELFGEKAGLAAAFLSPLAPELLIYTVRPLPQALGLALLPFAFLFLYKNKFVPAVITAILVSMVHQEAAFFFVGIAFLYGVGEYLLGEKRKAFTAFACWLAGTLAYVLWQMWVIGTPFFWELAQFKYNEGNPVGAGLFLEKTGVAITVLGAVGIVLLALSLRNKMRVRKEVSPELLALVAVLVGIILVKNDLLGLRVFMDRFIVYLQIPLIASAGYAVQKIIELSSTRHGLL
jgi:hypothetical protein